ncbi:transcription factor MYB39-like [Iris pallida]|uniref:Transcription factor MYB39-like n=1 Tax=Iris pallida TaxID=29817 RepID=A0AAX6IFS3_IRIPA|nr:transcription factor MYB39-like [Iris pallida]
MGLDPMTHRPRTDFLAALPGLLALANLRGLVDTRPWDDHSARLQAEAAKLQYLQMLLQSTSAPATADSNLGFNDIDMGSMGLFNQQAIPGMSAMPAAELPIPSYCYEQPLSNDGASCFASLLRQDGDGDGEEDGSPRAAPLDPLPPLADVSAGGNLSGGDACSTTSSCGGGSAAGMSSSFWPDLLLDDPFMNEFA